jgi:hypothetical protein
MGLLLKTVLSATLVGMGWFEFGQDQSAGEFWQNSVDLLDQRPAHTLLILGNSRTFANGMPQMVRRIADSASDGEKYEVTTVALPSATFQSLSENWRVRRLLSKEWDDVVLQGESRGQVSPELSEAFLRYGSALAMMAHARRHRPSLIVNWAYDPDRYPSSESRSSHLQEIAADHHFLASSTNLQEIEVSQIWERARSEDPSLGLTTDGNHPSAAGSYLVALAIYAKLSGRSVSAASYVPPELSTSDSYALRQLVDSSR